MLSPRILFGDTTRLIKVGMHRQAALWFGFNVWAWVARVPVFIIVAPLVLIHLIAEGIVEWLRSSRVKRYYVALDDKEDRWRDELRKEYIKRKESV